MRETPLWNLEFSNRRIGVANNLGPLAWDTFPGPLADVMPNAWPDKLVCDGLPSPFDSRMTKTMNHIKDAAPVGKGHEWASWSIGHIYVDVS